MITVDAINAIYTAITTVYNDDSDKAFDLLDDLMNAINKNVQLGNAEHKALNRVLDAVERIHIRKSVRFYSNLWKVPEQFRDDEIFYQRNEESHVADMLSYYRTTLKFKKTGDC